MANKEEADLRRHPHIEPFLISGAETTGKDVGHGAYGRVVEIKVDGAVCAAKEIHQILVQEGKLLSQQEKSTITDAFLRECKIMSSLRHPNITQFLGFCFLDNKATYPALVMERLATNLHSLLMTEEKPTHIPLGLKFSILRDVACGLAYLHHRSLVHRDLTATNVLLTSGMEAKIADLGVAREVIRTSPNPTPNLMTGCPGTIAYMPPEAMEKEARYSTSIDIFSWGVLTIFTLTQKFPEPLPATFENWRGTSMRTELERREEYMKEIRQKYDSQGRPARPVIHLIQSCLQNSPSKRPNIEEVLEKATKLKENNLEEDMTLNKVQFYQRVQEMKMTINMRDNRISRLETRLERVKKNIAKKLEELSPTEHKLTRSTSFPPLHKDETRPPLVRAHANLPFESVQKISAPQMNMQPLPATGNNLPKISRWKLPIKWRQGKDALFGAVSAQAVTIQQNVYIGCGHTKMEEQERIVQLYNPVEDVWTQLPECPTELLSLSSDGENLLISCDIGNGQIFYMKEDGTWQQKTLHPMSVGCIHSFSAFMCHHNFYAIACGLDKEKIATKSVNICDTTTSTWHKAQSLPVAGHSMSSALCGDTWYLSGVWEDMMPHIYKVSITSLIENATKGEVNTTSLWEEVPSPPTDRFHLMKFCNTLTTVGGKNYSQDIYQYDEDIRTWFKVGMLPVGLDAPIAIELPHSGELLVACGSTKEKPYSESVWIGLVTD